MPDVKVPEYKVPTQNSKPKQVETPLEPTAVNQILDPQPKKKK